MKWKWQVTDRVNWDKAIHNYQAGYTVSPQPFYIYDEGIVEGTRQDAIDKAKLSISSYRQIIRVRKYIPPPKSDPIPQ